MGITCSLWYTDDDDVLLRARCQRGGTTTPSNAPAGVVLKDFERLQPLNDVAVMRV